LRIAYYISRISSIYFNNTSLENHYERWKAYGQSITAAIWTANDTEKDYGSQGFYALSLDSGTIQTELSRHVPDEQKAAWGDDVFKP
jgi:hypothetical protein